MGFLGGKKKNVKPDFTGLQLQTAVATLPIPLLWGRQKMTGNLIWYNGFTAYQRSKQGKGRQEPRALGLGGGEQTAKPTTAPTSSSPCAKGRSRTSASSGRTSRSTTTASDVLLFGGEQEQANVGVADVVFYPPQAVAYSGTAYMAAAWYQMGTTPEIGNLSFEVFGNMSGTRRQRRRRRPRAGDLRLPHQPALRRRLRPRLDRPRRPCSARAATPACRPIASRSASPSRR